LEPPIFSIERLKYAGAFKGRLVSFEVAQRLLKYQDTTKIKSLAKELCFYVLWLLRYKQKRFVLKIAFCHLWVT